MFESISNSIPQADLSFQLLYFVILLKKLLILFQRQSQVLRYATGVEHIIAIGITSELPTPDFTPICDFLLQHCVFCVLFVSSLSQNKRNHNTADRWYYSKNSQKDKCRPRSAKEQHRHGKYCHKSQCSLHFSPLMRTAGEVAFRISISRILVKPDGFIQTTYFGNTIKNKPPMLQHRRSRIFLFLYCSALIFECTGYFRLIFFVSISFFELLFYAFYVFSKTLAL